MKNNERHRSKCVYVLSPHFSGGVRKSKIQFSALSNKLAPNNKEKPR